MTPKEQAEDEAMIARTVIELQGGMEYVLAHKFRRPGKNKDEPGAFVVQVCPCCMGCVWSSTGTAVEDSWDVYPDWRDGPWAVCETCRFHLESMAPAAAQVFVVSATAQLKLTIRAHQAARGWRDVLDRRITRGAIL